jgi:hypothetical protein
MTLKMTFAVIALALAPGLAFAQCDRMTGTKITASACGEGMVWDTVGQTCVAKPSS